MDKEMTRGRALLFLISLFLTNVAVMADMVIIPAGNGLYETFQNDAAVNFILSGPSFIMLFSAMLCGKLMQYLSKKKILIGAMILFAVSAILGGAVANVYYVLVMRILVGISMGFVNAAAMALIAEVYVDEDKRGTIMGIFNATMAGTGAVISLMDSRAGDRHDDFLPSHNAGGGQSLRGKPGESTGKKSISVEAVYADGLLLCL